MASSELVLMARNAERELRDCRNPSIYELTRAELTATWRRLLAEQLAQDRTGVPTLRARSLRTYSAQELSIDEILAGTRYRAARNAALAELPADADGLARWCRVAAGIERAAKVA